MVKLNWIITYIHIYKHENINTYIHMLFTLFVYKIVLIYKVIFNKYFNV